MSLKLLVTERKSTGPLDSPWGLDLLRIEERINGDGPESERARWESGRHLRKLGRIHEVPKELDAELGVSREELAARMRLYEESPDHPPGRSLDHLAGEINHHWDLFQQSARRTLEEALEIGRCLIEAKELFGWGGWQQWVLSHCPFGVRREQQFRLLAEHRDLFKCDSGSHLTITEALGEIRRLKVGEPSEIPPTAEVDEDLTIRQGIREEQEAGEAERRAQMADEERRREDAPAAILKTLKSGKAWVDSLYSLMRHHGDDLDEGVAKNIVMTLVEAKGVIEEAADRNPRLIPHGPDDDVLDVECVVVGEGTTDQPTGLTKRQEELANAFERRTISVTGGAAAVAELNIPKLPKAQLKRVRDQLNGAITDIHKLIRRLEERL